MSDGPPLMMGLVSDQHGNAALIYLNDEISFDELLIEVAKKLGLPKDHLAMSFAMTDQPNTIFKLLSDVDVRLMIDLHNRSQISLVNLTATVTKGRGMSLSAAVTDAVCIAGTSTQKSGEDFGDPNASGQIIRTVDMVNDNIRIPEWGHISITDVGQRFENANDVKLALIYFSVAKDFVYDFVKNDKTRVTIRCRNWSMQCTWRLHASQIKNARELTIKTYDPIHTCGGGIPSDGHPRVSRKWVSCVIQNLLKHHPAYRPIDVKKDVHAYYGVKVSYTTAWNANGLAQKELYGNPRHSYDLLRWYRLKVEETNPGSFIALDAPEGRFVKLFVCFHACYEGFIKGCRPMLFLDGTFLKDRYKGTLLSATAYDGNNGIFPLAYCVCNSEDLTNWSWFMGCLNSMIYHEPFLYVTPHMLVIISDSDKGLKEALKDWFRNAIHSHCILHIAQNYRNKFAKEFGFGAKDTAILGKLMESAAYKYTHKEFMDKLGEIKKISEPAVATLLDFEPEN